MIDVGLHSLFITMKTETQTAEEPEYQAGLVEKAIHHARRKLLDPIKRVAFDELEGIAFGPVDVPDAAVRFFHLKIFVTLQTN